MSKQPLAFAVPGDINRLTGGTIYDRRVIDELRLLGHEVTHIALPDSFPDPSPDEMQQALAQLAEVPAHMPLIVDGLAFGALQTEGVQTLQAPLVPLVHHPLAEESGLSEARRAHLFTAERDNLTHAQHVLVPSPHTAQMLTENYSVRATDITVARPGVDRPSADHLAITPDDPPLILAVGIQLPRKGHDVLIKALAQIKDLAWNAVIVGPALDPSFAANLEALRLQGGLEARLTLAGAVEQADLQNLFARASLFALATRYEGYGIVFDEALVHGLPIVSCTAGAVRDTVPADAGLLTPPDDPDAFAAALRSLLADTAHYDSCAKAAHQAGKALQLWSDTAATIAQACASTTKAVTG